MFQGISISAKKEAAALPGSIIPKRRITGKARSDWDIPGLSVKRRSLDRNSLTSFPWMIM